MSHKIQLLKKYAKKIPLLAPIVRAIKIVFRDWQQNTYKIEYINIDSEISLVKNRISRASYFLPYARRSDFNSIQLRILANGFHEHLRKKYTTEGFLIDPGDVVIDCGGFVGGFSIAACKANAKKVIYIEPTPLSRKCAKANFGLHGCDENISVIACGLGDKTRKGNLNISKSGADNSLLDPDEGATGESIEVDILTLDDLVGQYNLETSSTFLKIEAEGFEVEIVKGMNTFLPYKVVVDVSPERGGESPRDEIQQLLELRGYGKFIHTDRCMFARHSHSQVG